MTLNTAFVAALALALFMAAAVVSFVPLGGGTGPFGLSVQRSSTQPWN
jgi:hypothetical protein